jgi:alkaline phosphatase D
MDKIIPLFLLVFNVFISLQAQDPFPGRIVVDEALEPFYHGVASGDATSNKVIIWTRITTDKPSADVIWRMATDSLFQNIVSQGTVTTDAGRDYTVKVDVTGLEQNTWYFYEFEHEGKLSIRGRTKTLPAENIEHFRFVITSCASYPHGYFNAYQRIRERNDISAVIHLGDYIYEYGLNEYGNNADRKPDPLNEIVSLSDYRRRYSQYRLDPMLMRLHQQYPFYTIWDDHEYADNAWRDGANNHQPAREGDWNTRKSVALQAYLEWMPIREIDPDNKFKIYRNNKIGDLAEIFFLDTRILERENENDPDGPNKRLLGEEQMTWLQNGLKNSNATWKIIAQQVMVAPLTAFGLVLNPDQWDGYATERKRLFDFINANNINNVVVLTGDIHSHWANDLPFGTTTYNPSTGAGSAGVEFVCTSITSPGFPLSGVQGIIKAVNPHVKFNNLTQKGFVLVDVKRNRVQGDFYNVKTITQPDPFINYQVGYFTNSGSNRLSRTFDSTSATISNIDFAPEPPRDKTSTGIINPPSFATITGAYPNPFTDVTGLQFYVKEARNLTMRLIDLNGRVVSERILGLRTQGLYFETIAAGSLPAGTYLLQLSDGTGITGRSVVKIK